MQSSNSSSTWTKKAIALTVVLVLTVVSVAYVKSGGSSQSAAVGGMERQIRVSSYNCPPGTYETSRSPTGCICTLCPKGHACPGGVNAQKKPCTPGFYQPSTGQKNCKAASKGYYVPISGQWAQRACTPGRFQDQTGQSACKLARAGHYVPGSAAQIDIPCSAGTYQPSQGQRSCIDAPLGHYVPRGGATSKIPCPPGYYADATKQKQCKIAAKGHYVSNEGSSYQTKCHTGTFQPWAGKKACIPASAGWYVNREGQWTQTQCPGNTYQPCGGQHACIPCPSNRGSPGRSTSCPYYRACVQAKGSVSTTFGKVRVGKTGPLKSVKVMRTSGIFKYCGPNSNADCSGYYGTKHHGFDLFITRRNYKDVLFPLKGDTKGFSPANAARYPSYPFYRMSGLNAGSTAAVTYTATSPKTVTNGEELRVYMGELLFNHASGDNVGEVCYNMQFTIG